MNHIGPAPDTLGETFTNVRPDEFRDAMSCLGAAVHIVTTDGVFGKGAFTATSVVPVTDSPPMLLVCLNRAAVSGASMRGNAVFCVNTLCEGDRSVADTFAGRTTLRGVERFRIGEWQTLATGSPVLRSAVVAFDCRLEEIKAVASHDIYFGSVTAIRRGVAGPGLIYHGREYKSL